MAHRVFVAFAGGGAKALIHVGVLRALESRDVDFVGVAGTSAGSVVAALKAAGLTADDLVNCSARTTLLSRLKEIDPTIRQATDLFGRGGWRRLRLFRRFVAHLIPYLFAAGGVLFIGIFVSGWLLTPYSMLLALLAGVAFFALSIALVTASLSGLITTARLRSTLNILLQQTVFPDEPGRTVVMSDFGKDGRPILKIVSANLSRRRLHLFSPDLTPDTPVADAVAASMALPIVFRPTFIDGELHVDGGIVSNLPAWSFDEERALDPDAATIAIEIANPTGRTAVSIYNWLPAFIRTGLFGSGELNLRASGEAERLVLSSRLGLLDFDLSADTAFEEVADAERAASIRLDKRLFRRPELYANACEVARSLVDDVLAAVLEVAPGRTRVAAAVPDRGYYHSLRLRFAVGYDQDPDEGLLLPIVGSVTGQAYMSGESQFEIAPLPLEVALPGCVNRQRRNLGRAGLAWILAIPIFHVTHTIPRLVVQIDGDNALPRSAALDTAITQIEAGVREFFALITQELIDVEADHDVDE